MYILVSDSDSIEYSPTFIMSCTLPFINSGKPHIDYYYYIMVMMKNLPDCKLRNTILPVSARPGTDWNIFLANIVTVKEVEEAVSV